MPDRIEDIIICLNCVHRSQYKIFAGRVNEYCALGHNEQFNTAEWCEEYEAEKASKCVTQ